MLHGAVLGRVADAELAGGITRAVLGSVARVAVVAYVTLVCTGAFASTPSDHLPAARCALCHSRIADPLSSAKASVAPYSLWKDSAMSFASRDPYWHARVRDEAGRHPEKKAEIEDKCLRCHAPAYQHPLRGRTHARLEEISETGRDGVTCTVCHRVDGASLRSPASFAAGFEITKEKAIYGPHDDPFAMPMLHHTGFRPEQSKHMLSAALCGSCHTLVIHHDGGVFVEQAPYLEWRASGYPGKGTTCISCHMPLLSGPQGEAAPQYIAHRPPGGWFPPTEPRSPFRLHSFAGANAQLLRSVGGTEGGDPGTLLSKAAILDVAANVRNGVAVVEVRVTNKTGHKLPTGFPGRRMWLHVVIRARDGATVFESGGWSGTGDLKRAVQPHRRTVSSPDDMVVYEAVVADGEGRPTNSLISARRFAKDNRILPAGFRPEAEADFRDAIVPVGTAGDPGFQPGSHVSSFEVKTGSAGQPLRVRVELVFQSVAAAELDRLLPAANPDAARELRRLRENAQPIVIASREIEVSDGNQRR